MTITATAEKRRAIAIEFVRGLLRSGYTVHDAAQESFRSHSKCGDGEQSYVIKRGRIRVPYAEDGVGDWFSFRALAKEVESMPRVPKDRTTSTRVEQLQLI